MEKVASDPGLRASESCEKVHMGITPGQMGQLDRSDELEDLTEVSHSSPINSYWPVFIYNDYPMHIEDNEKIKFRFSL